MSGGRSVGVQAMLSKLMGKERFFIVMNAAAVGIALVAAKVSSIRRPASLLLLIGVLTSACTLLSSGTIELLLK